MNYQWFQALLNINPDDEKYWNYYSERKLLIKALSEKSINSNIGKYVRLTLAKEQSALYYLTDLTETDVEALRVGTLAANVSGNYSFNAGEYKWICYPTSFGLKTTFKDASTNFDVAMQPALTKSITNSQGVSTNYYCHRTVNKLGGSITIAIS